MQKMNALSPPEAQKIPLYLEGPRLQTVKSMSLVSLVSHLLLRFFTPCQRGPA